MINRRANKLIGFEKNDLKLCAAAEVTKTEITKNSLELEIEREEGTPTSAEGFYQ